MYGVAGRAALWGARRFGIPALRSAGRFAMRYAAPAARRIGSNIAMRPMGRSAGSAIANRGFATMRGMGARAFATGAARGAINGGAGGAIRGATQFGRIAGVAGAGALAAGAANNRFNSNKRKAEDDIKRQKRNNGKEQKAVGDSGDDIKTKDSFVNKTGNKKFLTMQMLSGPRIIKYETTGGCLGSQGRAVWGFIRYKPFASTDANLWSSAGGLKAAEVLTNVNWRNDNLGAGAAPDWQVGDDMIQRGYLDRKFVLEKQVIKTEFKNQGKSPVHLEYYVVAYANSDATGRDVFRDVLDGYSATHGIQTSADLPSLLTATNTSEGRMDTNLEDSLGKSSIFRKNWNIKYKHKVRLPEGGVHEFNYVNDANRIINWNGIYKRNSANSDIELNIAAVKGITFHIIWKVYGSLGDNSTGINTVAVGGISTGDSKLIYRTTCSETYRHCMAAPRLVIDEKTRLPTDLTNIYDRDGGTGAQDDTMT